MAEEKINFGKLTKKEKELLLSALDIDKDNMTCHICGKKAGYETCSIISPKVAGTDKTVILCESTLCMSEFVGEIEKKEALSLLKDKMLECSHCGKPFVHATDPKTGKESAYIWKPDCDCLGKNFMVSLG